MTEHAVYISLLTATEIGLGSLLHALHIPFRGQFLSLNQIAILSHAVKNHPVKTAPMTISTITALLKSLSPIGKRLTPMLAITMQGLLYTIGILLGGRTGFGRALGAVFASLWSFVQPALLYSIIFGKSFWQALSFINAEVLPKDALIFFLTAIITCKVVCGICVALLAPRLPIQFFQKISYYKSSDDKKEAHSTLLKALTDLLRPSFLLSLAMVAFLFCNTCISSDIIAIQLLRPIAIAYLVSVCMYVIPVEKLFSLVLKGKENSFRKALKEAYEKLQK